MARRWKLAARFAPMLILVWLSPATACANPVLTIPGWWAPYGLVISAVSAVAIEVLVAALFRLRFRTLAVIAVLNLVTNVTLNMYVQGFGTVRPTGQWWAIPALEALVVVVEAGVLLWFVERPPWTTARVFGLSLLMNTASFVGGAFIMHWILVYSQPFFVPAT